MYRIALVYIILAVACSVTAQAQRLTIDRIIDGDTFRLSSGQIVNLLGVRAPGDDDGHAQDCPVAAAITDPHLGALLRDRARRHAVTWLEGQEVSLERDSRISDGDGIEASSVYLWVIVGRRRMAQANALMVADGFAQACMDGPHRLRRTLQMHQINARNRQIGLWEPSGDVHFPGAGMKLGISCQGFTTYKDAEAFFLQEGGPRYDPFLLDADEDGVPCERLLGEMSPYHGGRGN